LKDLKKKKRGLAKPRSNRAKKQPRNWREILRKGLYGTLMVGSATLVAVGSGLLARAVLDSGYFNVANIVVAQESRVSEEAIIALSNVNPGDNLLRLNLETIGNKVADHPWIARVDVRRNFPDTLVIEVVEREPVAILNLGYLYCVDKNGEVFKLLEGDDPLDMPVITGINRDYLIQDQPQVAGYLRHAVSLLEDLEGRRSFGLDEVSELNLTPDGGIVLFTYIAGVPVELGLDDYRAKLDRLERIYKELRPRLPLLRNIDLTVADRVIVSRSGAAMNGAG